MTDDPDLVAAQHEENDELVTYLRRRTIALNAAVRRLTAQVAQLQQERDNSDGVPGDSEHGDGS